MTESAQESNFSEKATSAKEWLRGQDGEHEAGLSCPRPGINGTNSPAWSLVQPQS